MRTRYPTYSAALLVLCLTWFATPVAAAPPAPGPVAATNLQGVSALLKGDVDPGGVETSYRFQYSTAADFSGAVSTAATPAGDGSGSFPARAAIDGLSPATTYHVRLLASNADGSVAGPPGTFTTTQGFGFESGEAGFAASVFADGGAPATALGSHPYQLSFSLGLRRGGDFEEQPGVPFPDGDLRDLRVEMPAGMIVNPMAITSCSITDFRTPRSSPFEASASGESCPGRSQVGTVELRSSAEGGEVRRFGIFNLAPPPGVPAQLGFAPFGSPIVLNQQIRANGDGSYALTLEAANVPQGLDFYGLEVTLWGTPWGVSHDGERDNCLNEAEPGFPWAKCPAGDPTIESPRAYLTLPHRCSQPLSFAVTATSWQQPATATATAVNRDGGGDPALIGPCGGFGFAPKAVAQLNDTKASSPSGYSFALSADNANLLAPAQNAPAPIKRAVLTLPDGTTINPSVAVGLGVCTPAEYAAETAFTAVGGGCPEQSKLGEFTVRSALFSDLLRGSIYLARPDDPATPAAGAENPFDSMIAVYLVARLPQRGVMVKLAGRIDPDPASGNIVASFDGMPQLPYTELNLSFRTGQRSLLVTPPVCGSAVTTTELLPWAGSAVVRANTTSQIKTGIGGGPCPAGTPPFAPAVSAGAANSNVNSYTPYVVRITRKDTEQEITSYALTLPQGITGKLAGIPFCPEAAIAAARTRRGAAEAASPSCPAASEVGHTLSGYGVGAALAYAEGRVYLAGPYGGAPLSLVAVNPATVGPFDLGTIVVRSGFSVDPRTAQLRIDTAAADPIPHILGGVPIHLRELRILIDRPEFTHNPSSCVPSQLTSTVGGSGARFGDPSDDTAFASTAYFQLLNCRTIGFKPKLGIRLRGSSRRGGFPQLRTTFAARGFRDSNLREIAVSMPHSMFLAQNHIRGICTRPQFAADRCPQGSVYGRAVAYTPLFDEPLRGDVYLRSSANKLPDLVASLHSGAIRIVLEGRIGPTKQGGIRARFSDLPDQPLSRFVMTLYGGRHGLLQNSANICAAPPLANVKALAQNNFGVRFVTTLRGQCGKHGSGKKKRGRGRR